MLADFTYVVKEQLFRFWFANTFPAAMPDGEKLALIKALYDCHAINIQELSDLGSVLNNPNLLVNTHFTPSFERTFTQPNFYVQSGEHSFGLLRHRTTVSNTSIDLVIPHYGGLYDLEFSEEFGIVPLEEELFLCRTIQPAALKTREGVTQPFCIIIPASIAWNMPHKYHADPILFGGYRFKGQAKPIAAPPEVTALIPEVTTAFQITHLKKKE